MVLNNQLKDSSFNNNLTTKLTNMLNMNTNGSSNNNNVKQQLSISNKLNSIINTNNNSSTSCANQSNVNNGLSSNTNNNISSNNIVNGNSSSASTTSTTFNHVGNLVNGGASPSAASTPSTKVLSSDDKKINLNALKNQDPFATNILDTALRVAVYKFLSKKNEWKKMDVEGSLFLFERMVEPLHSFAVMNTLALNLFLQPITSDLEFQDRNPFLLYKSNNDIFGIWFIDKEDCERIKNLIVNLTTSAKERRERKLQQKSSSNNILNGNNNASASLSEQTVDLINNLMTPVSLEKKSLSNSLNKLLLASSTNNVNNSINETSDGLKNEKNNVDILDMLAKAQQQFNNHQNTNTTANNVKNSLSILEPTSHSTPGGANIFVDNNNEPKTIISQWPLNDLILNSNQYIKPEPIRAANSNNDNTNDTSLISDNSLSADKINPILKLLMSSNSIANMPSNTNTGVNNESTSKVTASAAANDQLSLDLKRKLNILGSSNNILSSPITVTGSMSNSSMILTPSNSSAIMSSTTNNNNQTSATLESVINILKKPITVKDFEENFLNNPSLSQQSTPSTTSSSHHNPKTAISNMFYLPNDTLSLSSSNDLLYNKLISASNSAQKVSTSAANSNTAGQITSKDTKNANNNNNVKDQKLSIGSLTTTSISSVTCSSNNSTSSSSSTSSDSSDSDSEPQSPNTLPLLLTPAAFESSASSTTSSSFNPAVITTTNSNINLPANNSSNHFFNNLLTNISQNDSSVNTTTNSNIASKLSTTTASTTTTNNNNNTNSSSSIDLNEHANNFANSFENILISNINEKNNGSLNNDNCNIQQMSLLNKNQLQQVLVHLLNVSCHNNLIIFISLLLIF